MGGIAKKVGGAVTSPLGVGGGLVGGLGGGVNSLLSPLGLGGEQGEYYQPGQFSSSADPAIAAALAQGQQQQNVVGGQKMADIVQGVQGGGNIKDALSSLDQFRGADFNTALNQLATGPGTGMQFATQQVQSNPILAELFKEGGALNRAGQEEQKLASQGYKLQPEDYEAYGQASGNIARMFGSQEQDIARQLAERGLSAAPSGVAGAAYSGLLGNKYEQLGRLQSQIADQRMQSNLQRLNQTRNFMAQLGQQGAQAIDQQYRRQLAGVENQQGQQQQNLANQMAKRQQDIGLHTQNEQNQQASLQSKAANKGKTIFDALGGGIYQGVQGAASGASSAGMKGLMGV